MRLSSTPARVSSFHKHYSGFTAAAPAEDRMIPTISPYSARASEKMKMSKIPVNSLGCCAFARTPASPVMPMAMPAARPERPQAKPDDRCAYPWKRV